MMKILVCCDYMAPYEGNFIASIKKLDDEIKRIFDITYLFPRGQNESFLKWFNVFASTHKVKTVFPGDYDAIFNEAGGDYDFIYLHFFSIEFARIMANSYKDKKIIFHGHHMPIIKKWRAVVELFKSINKRYNNLYVIACSKEVKKAYTYMVKNKNVFLIHNCIDFKRIDNLISMSEKKNNNGLYVISMFGGEYYTKGVDVACKAITHLSRENVVLNIYCSHNLENNKKIIENKFPKNKFQLLESKSNPCDIYLNSDLFIAPSRFEGFNYSILECIYCGTPVVASNLKVHKHVGCNYLFFRKNNYRSLARKIDYVIKNKNVCDTNNEAVIRNYDIGIWVESVKKLFIYLKGEFK